MAGYWRVIGAVPTPVGVKLKLRGRPQNVNSAVPTPVGVNLARS